MKLLRLLLVVVVVSSVTFSCKKSDKEKIKDDVNKTATDVKDAAVKSADKVKEVANEAAEDVKDAANSTKESIEKAGDEVVKDVNKAADEVKEKADEVTKWVKHEVYFPRDVKLQNEVVDTKKLMAKANPRIGGFFGQAYAYAIFPKITKGAFVVGGAGGKGLVFVGPVVIGESTLMQATVGAQIGGQQYSEFIFFKDKAALDRFKNKKFKFAGELSAVAWDKADSRNINYQNGVAVYTYNNKGLMAEASLGAQRFKYKDGVK